MALTTEDLDILDEAIATGELTVKMDGREVTYRSIAELRAARRHVFRVINANKGRRMSPLSGIVARVDRGIR